MIPIVTPGAFLLGYACYAGLVFVDLRHRCLGAHGPLRGDLLKRDLGTLWL